MGLDTRFGGSVCQGCGDGAWGEDSLWFGLENIDLFFSVTPRFQTSVFLHAPLLQILNLHLD